jgi:hypothetical protein
VLVVSPALSDGSVRIFCTHPYLSAMPKIAFEPCLPTRGTKVPTGPDWLHQYGKISMSRCSAFVIALLLGSLAAPASAYAQLTPPAGSAGAGNSPISGVPFGPANPSVLSDPSGIGNASRVPPLGTNPPTPVISSIPSGSSPSRVVVPYAGASQPIIIISADQIHSRKPRAHGHRPARP